MSNNLPWGDAYIVGTPNIDRAAQDLRLQERQRELLRQRQAEALDQEFQKNMSNIRDADVKTVTDKYGKWKMANQAAAKEKRGVTPEKQLELLRLKSDMYESINASKRGKEDEENQQKEYLKNPDAFDDNAPAYFSVRRKLPISQWGQSGVKDANGVPLDFNDYNTFRYKGTDTDFSKILKDAEGTPRQVHQEESELDGGLQFKITPYMYGNTPAQFQQKLLGALSQHKAGRDAAAFITQTPPEVIEQVQEKFKAIPLERWKQMGSDPQAIIIEPDDSKAEIFSKHQAQLYALNNEPKQGTPVFRENKAKVMAEQEAKERRMEALRNANAAGLVRLRASLKEDDPEEKDLWIDSYVEAATNEARNNKSTRTTITKDGKKVSGKEINVDPILAKAVGIDAKNPGTIIVTADGNYVPIFYETDGDGRAKMGGTGNYEIKREMSSPLSEYQLKVAMGKQSGVKQMNKEAVSASGNQKPNAAPKKVVEDLRKKYNY